MKSEEMKEIETVIILVERLIAIVEDQQRQVADLTVRVINLENQTREKNLLQQQRSPLKKGRTH